MAGRQGTAEGGRRRAPDLSGGANCAMTDALRALDLSQGEPRDAAVLAARAVSRALKEGDLRAASIAERALGLTDRWSNNAAASASHFRRAIRLADRAGDATLAGEARTSLALTLASMGNSSGALREIDRASAVLRGPALAGLRITQALIFNRMGRIDEALEGYRRALPVLRRCGDRLREARLLNNRGLLHLMSGSLAQAETDLVRARDILLTLGQTAYAAGVAHNLGFLASRRGDVPAALARYDEAQAELSRAGLPSGLAVLPLCELLLSVRLVAEARQYADECVRELELGGMLTDLAEARLMQAEVALAGGDLVGAGRAARQASEAFLRQRRPAWAALARYSEVRVLWQQGDRSDRTRRSAQRTARELRSFGWPIRALDALLIAGRVALAQGRPDLARPDLVAASRARSRGPINLRARAWHAEALLRLADGNRRGACRALRTGLSHVEAHRWTLGATELRVQVGGHGEELASLGLRIALESGRARSVLEWAERWRAGTLTRRPVTAVDDKDLARELTELRRVVGEVDRAALLGRSTASLLRRQAELESAVARRCRRVAGDPAKVAGQRLAVDSLAAELGDRALVELVECDTCLYAVVLAGHRFSFHALGDGTAIHRELAALRAGLRRLAYGSPSRASAGASLAAVRHGGQRLNSLLLIPLLRRIEERELVIVPTGTLHAVPWSMLASCAVRPLTVSPSALLWERSACAPPRRSSGGVALVAGPALPGAEDEVRALAGHYGDAELLVGERASIAEVKRAMTDADLLHLASHGSFRADNPLFSSLQLHDGPLNIYDLERVGRVPGTIVLAACNSGLSDVRPGDELMGVASGFLSLGARTIVASVIPIPDGPTRPLMVRMHGNLARGIPPARALASARQDMDPDDVADVVTGAAFVCLGTG